MSLMTPDWQPLGGINANHLTGKYHADPEHIYRAIHPAGSIHALNYPTAGVTGTLVRRRRLNPVERTTFVATNPLSKGVGS